jgi:hypothetical protein
MMRDSQAFRLFTTERGRNELFAKDGNEMQNYTGVNIMRRVDDRCARVALGSAPEDRGPGQYTTPLHNYQWWKTLSSTAPSTALRIAFFHFDLAQNWDRNSLRMTFFLPATRVQSIKDGTGSALSYTDWCSWIVGMGETFGAFYEDELRSAFQ